MNLIAQLEELSRNCV